MKSRIAIGSWLLIAALVGCGDDSGSSSSDKDAGTDGGENTSGTGGKSGSGGQSAGGKGGQSSAGTGGEGEGGNGGSGGDGSEGTTYTIGGEVSGLKGSGLVLRLNDGNDLGVSKDGGFVFSKELAKDADYHVSVKTQPTNPVQACTIKSGDGKVGEEDVESVEISCSDVTRSVGGKVTGIGGGNQIKLKNNGGDDLTVSADGTFTFHTALMPGAGYEVIIDSAPSGRTCSLTKAKGTLGDSNITDVTIACYEALTLAARGRPGSVGLTWNDNGATSYTVFASTDKACFDGADVCGGAMKQENQKSPAAFLGLTNGTVYYFSVRGNHPDDFTTRSPKENIAAARPNDAAFDKDVNAIAKGGDIVYVGGSFSSVGAFTGPVVPLDKNSGTPSRLPGFFTFPTIPGSISQVLADGSGGYFVAGRFDLDNGISNLAHVTNTGAIDEMWKPQPGPVDMGKTVRAIALAGQTLYLSGDFTTVGGTGRPGGFAAVSTTGTGALVTAFNPSVTNPLSVDAIAATADTVFVGGRFTAIGGQTRAGLAALNASDGTATSWDPNPRVGPDPGEIRVLALGASVIYVAGDFDSIGTQTRGQIAAINISGTDSGKATAFTAAITGPDDSMPPVQVARAPETMGLDGNVLYIGGNFTNIGSDARNRLAALDGGTGAVVTGWNPSADKIVRELAVSGDRIYVAGDFENTANTARKYLAAIDKSGNLVSSWDPRPNAACNSVSADGDSVYVGGGTAVATFGAEQYAGLAAFSGNSLTQWSAAVSGGNVLALAVSGDNIYFGGGFTKVGTDDRNGVAVLDKNGKLGSWNANLTAGASVHALAANSDSVYLGGKFTTSTGNRTNLVALKTSDATIPDAWTVTGATGQGGSVDSLALDGTSKLYVGGDFGNVGGTSRARLAALDPTSGAVDSSWNPNAGSTGSVQALVLVGNQLVAGGTFTSLGGNPHPAIGAITKTGNGTVDGWEPAIAADPNVRALATGAGDALYAGGTFTTVGTGMDNAHLRSAAFDSSALPYGTLTGTPDASGTSVNALLYDGGKLYLGGNFYAVNGGRCFDYCAVTYAPPP